MVIINTHLTLGAICKVPDKVKFCRVQDKSLSNKTIFSLQDKSYSNKTIFPFQAQIIQQRKNLSFPTTNHTVT